ncbi:T9SS type A sorting domain-containing protein [Fulvivirga kasyanovii]|nr:T9SS type A sorting domain-containing protein [Fulvivirga kasyanovii]
MIKKAALIFGGLLFIMPLASAQNTNGHMSVRVTKTIGYYGDGSNGSPEYKHRFVYDAASPELAVDGGAEATWYNTSLTLYNGSYTNAPQNFYINYRAYEYDGGGGGDNDDAKIGPIKFNFYPLQYTAGSANKIYILMYMLNCSPSREMYTSITAYTNRVNQLRSIPSCAAPIAIYDWIYGAEITVQYTTPTPILSELAIPAQKCLNDYIHMDVKVNPAFSKDVSYTYEYLINREETEYLECVPNPAYCGPCSGGTPLAIENPFGAIQNAAPIDGGNNPCCDEPPTICTVKKKLAWRALPASAYIAQELTNQKDTVMIHLGSIPGISSKVKSNGNTKVEIRARAKADNSTSDYSNVVGVDISAAAPTFTIASVTPSCQGAKTGTIQLTNVKGLGSYRYFVQTGQCPDPEDDSCVGIGAVSGTFSGTNYTITGVPPGKLYIYIANIGGALGNCATSAVKTVDAIALPAFITMNPDDVSCPEGGDGSVSFSVAGGKEPFNYSISNNAGTFKVGGAVREGSFTGLKAGEYKVTVTDGCLKQDNHDITIEQPAKVSATSEPTAPQCANEPDGHITIDASYDKAYGSYVLDGSGKFNYRLYDDSNQLVDEELNTTSTSHTFSGLPGGAYTIKVNDVEQSGCTPFEKTETVEAVVPLAATLVDQQNISCYNAADGRIELSGSGGFNTYIYRIRHVDSGNDITNSNGQFTGLEPGDYEMFIKNDAACTDQYQVPGLVTLTQPDEMVINVTQKNITCFESDNGQLTVSAEGLLSNYTFQWEWNGASYKSGNQSQSMSLTGLFPGIYQLTVTNSNGCVKSSQSYKLEEPEILTIDAVDVERPECFGEVDGAIIPHMSGGWGDFTWYYSDDNQTTWTAYDENKQFGPATYHIKVIDIEGCETVYPDAIEFLAPDEPLDLELSITSRNGYGVSCFGGADGEVNLTGSGGIAFNSDSPYLYSVDSEAFATAPVIGGLAAGDHTFYIKDANGCVVEKILNLPEPEVLGLSLANKTDVKCFGDNSGSITMVANGGVAGYEYNINGGAYVAEPSFASLTSGTYTLGVKDLNGCETFTEVTIIELNNPMELGATVVNSSCYTYDNGHIETTMQGGVEPYSYSWSHGAATKDVASLAPGTYTLTVTDAEGCITQGEYEITEPDNIDIEPEATLCQGQTYTIDVTYDAVGAQYFWSSPNGFTSNDARITIEQEGIYTAEVSLPNGCVMSEQFELKRSDVLFNVNFLTATELEAGDTVVLVDVTDPRPDSVEWYFGGDIKVIDASEGHPQLFYSQAGEYEIGFTAYFGGCVDHQTKTIKVYNKDEKPNNGRIFFGEIGIKTAKVYPNPNQGKFEVALELHQRADLILEIYDMYGLMVTEKQFSGRNFYTTSFDLSDQQSGVYLLRAVSGDEETVIKVLVNK